MADKTDILLVGATGFTGVLIARYLNSHPDFKAGRFTFALGARSSTKCSGVFKTLNIHPNVPFRQLDVLDAESVRVAVRSTHVVINAIGPYWRWGKLVARTCAEEGVHYVDLTAEPPFIKWLIDECHTLAESTGAVLIPSSGQDSVPSDLTVHLANKALKAAAPGAAMARSFSAFAMQATGVSTGSPISGGSLDSVATLFDEVPRRTLAASFVPWALSPIAGVPQPGFRLTYTLPLHPHVVGGAFFMCGIDQRIVQRTWGLLERERRLAPDDAAAGAAAYGPEFTYDEMMVTPTWLGAFGGAMLSAFVVLTVCACVVPPVRWLLRKLLPSGSGPSAESFENSSLTLTNVTSSAADAATPVPVHVRTTMVLRGEAGYFLTSIEIAECALALALEKDTLPPLGRTGGVLTPASALGDVLVRRLEATGRFAFRSERLDAAGRVVPA